MPTVGNGKLSVNTSPRNQGNDLGGLAQAGSIAYVNNYDSPESMKSWVAGASLILNHSWQLYLYREPHSEVGGVHAFVPIAAFLFRKQAARKGVSLRQLNCVYRHVFAVGLPGSDCELR